MDSNSVHKLLNKANVDFVGYIKYWNRKEEKNLAEQNKQFDSDHFKIFFC